MQRKLLVLSKIVILFLRAKQ